MLAPLLINIDLIGLFLESEDGDIASYADDTTPYSCAQDISSVKVNLGKCHAILSSNTQREIRFVNTSIASSPSEKLLGITLDSELELEDHINKICNIVNKKLNALHRTGSHMSLDKRKIPLRAFIESQFRITKCLDVSLKNS